MTLAGLITEVKLTASRDRQEFVCRLLDRSATHVAVLYKSTRARRVGDLRLPKGTVTYGYFWSGRPHNVYHWVHSHGRTLGYYVKLADSVVFRPRAVEWRDLTLDLLFSPDGRRAQILDEDELATLSPGLQAKAQAARTHVLTHRDEILAEVAACNHAPPRCPAPRRGERNRRAEGEPLKVSFRPIHTTKLHFSIQHPMDLGRNHEGFAGLVLIPRAIR